MCVKKSRGQVFTDQVNWVGYCSDSGWGGCDRRKYVVGSLNQKNMQSIFEKIYKKVTTREMLTEFLKFHVQFYPSKGEKKRSRGMAGLLASAMRSERIRQVFNTRYKQFEKNIGKIIEIGKKNGEIAPHVDTKAMAAYLRAITWGLWLQYDILEHENIESLRENLFNILLNNIWSDVKKKKK